MKTEKTAKTISRKTYLQALGIFTAANRHYLKAEEMMEELADLLNCNDADGNMGHISDVAVDGKPDFDGALAKEKYTVRKEKRK